jgi:hypothetical protein
VKEQYNGVVRANRNNTNLWHGHVFTAQKPGHFKSTIAQDYNCEKHLKEVYYTQQGALKACNTNCFSLKIILFVIAGVSNKINLQTC